MMNRIEVRCRKPGKAGIIILISILVLAAGVSANRTAAQGTVLETYIREGLENNLALKQKEQNYRSSLAVLKEARAMFYPDLSFNARYTVAEGGRIIEFPLGDLFNPIYNTLNLLTASTNFKPVENQEFPFYRPTEQETKLSLVQPVYDPRLYYNNRIRGDLAGAQRADADTYRRKLVAEIKTAYFSYMKSLELGALLEDTRDLLEENLRVSRSLYKNQKVSIDKVYRSESELSKLERQAAEAEKSRNVAAAWFNFLLNRPFGTEIEAMEPSDTVLPVADISVAGNSALSNREELDMLERYYEAASENVGLNKSAMLPSVYAAVEYGYQGEKYGFTPDDDFLLASVVLKWDIFHGLGTRARISRAKAEHAMRYDQLEEARKKISLEVIGAYYELEASEKSVRSAGDELRSARAAFRVVEKKFAQGQAGLLEYIDARTAMTSANSNLIIAKYDRRISYAEFERAAGLYTFGP